MSVVHQILIGGSMFHYLNDDKHDVVVLKERNVNEGDFILLTIEDEHLAEQVTVARRVTDANEEDSKTVRLKLINEGILDSVISQLPSITVSEMSKMDLNRVYEVRNFSIVRVSDGDYYSQYTGLEEMWHPISEGDSFIKSISSLELKPTATIHKSE